MQITRIYEKKKKKETKKTNNELQAKEQSK